MTSKSRHPIAAACLLALTGAAGAAPVVYDSFDNYTSGAALAGQVATGTGLTGNYSNSTNYQVTAAGSGLTFSTLSTNADGKGVSIFNVTSGQAVAVQNNSTLTGTIYSSYLIRYSAQASGVSGSFTDLRVSEAFGSASSNTDTRFRALGETNGSTVGAIGASYNNPTNSASAVGSGTGVLALNTTYLVVGRFTNVNGVAGQTGVASVFALSASQYDFFMSDGLITDAELDGAAEGTADGQVTSKATDSDLTTANTTFQPGDWIQFSAGNSTAANGTENLVFDEVRWGGSLADVTAVPEPGTLACLATPALLALTRRRRR